jgi:drug/metabolite transporter (DMT)-like permease
MDDTLSGFRWWGEVAALGTASCWTLASMVFTHGGRRIGPFNLNKLRIPLAALLLGAMLLLTGNQGGWEAIATADYGWLALSGIIGLVLGDSSWFASLVAIGPRRATLLMSTAPVMTALLGWPLLGERLGWLAWTGIIITLGGITWVTAEREFHANGERKHVHPTAILLGLGGAAGQAVGLVIAKHAIVHSDILPLKATFLRMISAATAIWIFALIRKQGKSTLALMRDRTNMLVVAAGAVLGPFLGVWMSLIAVRHIEAGVAATIMATVPILILPMVILVYKEKVSPRAVFGAILAVGGVALLFWR